MRALDTLAAELGVRGREILGVSGLFSFIVFTAVLGALDSQKLRPSIVTAHTTVYLEQLLC